MLIHGKPATALKVRFRDGVLEIAPKDAQTDLKLFRRHEEVEAAYQTIKLDGMRSQRSWQKRKERAAKKVWAVAADLVRMYAERQELKRTPCAPDGRASPPSRRASSLSRRPTSGRHLMRLRTI